MKQTLSFLIFAGSFFVTIGTFAQGLPREKPDFEFIRNGSLLTVRTSEGKEVANFDLDKPALKGKVLAFTYSAKKRPQPENAMNTMNIFPNPASKEVQLNLKGNWKYPVDIQILDRSGNTLQRNSLESSERALNIASLRQGIYILKAESGESKAIEKLVVE